MDRLDAARHDPTPDGGLTAGEASRLLREVGPNELPRPRRRGLGRILLGVLREPTFLLLALAAAVYLVFGGVEEGLLLTGFAALSILLVVAQENRSESAIEALRALAAPMAHVVRDGRIQRIEAREVVPGDLLLVADGERVAADAVLRTAEAVSVDESLLTGESMPVMKCAAPPEGAAARRSAPGDASMVYASTLVTAGRGVAEVVATGAATEAGRIGVSLATIEVEPTLLQRSFGRLVAVFAVLAVCASVLVTLLFGFLRGAWLQGTLSGIALGMSALPEEFPMVLAVFVALGARRLAKLHVLVRRTAVIEMLGACSTLCVDKTGTLTENRMRVCSLADADDSVDWQDAIPPLAAPFVALVRCAMRASPRTSSDPMDVAIHHLADAARIEDPLQAADSALVREFGLTRERPAVVRVWRDGQGALHAAAKGAPETIADLCALPDAARTDLLRTVEHRARNGVRVLALAQCRLPDGAALDDPARFGMAIAGLIGFADPLRAGAREAIAQAQRAGVSVVMMTGDFPATAMAIARQAGIDCSSPPATGIELAAADDAGLRQIVRDTRVFARIRPEQKLRIVRALKDDGEIVAMTGDGVNDAPALKAAHIGLAMGKRGTDVARESASVVLLEDDLRHLISGIEMGRRIFDNLRKASLYIVAIHVPIIGLALLPLLLGLPPMFMPTHVVLIEMVIDPICAIAFENEPVEPGTMDQPPRAPADPLLGWPQLAVGVAQGLLLLCASFGVFVLSLEAGIGQDVSRTLAFIAFTAGNIVMIRVAAIRGSTLAGLFTHRNTAYWIVAGIAVLVTGACIVVPQFGRLFRFETPPPGLALAAVVAGVASALVFDLAKKLPSVQHVLGRPDPHVVRHPDR